MKKSLLALAAFGLFAGAASAQSTVTLFGVIDAGFARLTEKTSTGKKSIQGISNSGLNSSRLGFRGVEDLGGGLKAGFWLEGQLYNDTGDGSATGSALNFQRRSTVSLMGNFGEVRIGRDYTPTFTNLTTYDPFGTNGVGSAMTIGMVGNTLGNTSTAARSSNSIGYFLPGDLGGFTGNFMVGFGENVSGGPKTNNFAGGRLGYNAGPISVNAAYSKVEGATDATDTKVFNVGGSYDAGVVKPILLYTQEKTGAGLKISAIEGGVTVPLGQGEIRAAYSHYDVKNSKDDWDKLAVGYGYNLSKRTQLYSTFARVINKGIQTKTVTTNGLAFPSSLPAAPGKNSSGVELGVRHFF